MKLSDSANRTHSSTPFLAPTVRRFFLPQTPRNPSAYADQINGELQEVIQDHRRKENRDEERAALRAKYS